MKRIRIRFICFAWPGLCIISDHSWALSCILLRAELGWDQLCYYINVSHHAAFAMLIMSELKGISNVDFIFSIHWNNFRGHVTSSRAAICSSRALITVWRASSCCQTVIKMFQREYLKRSRNTDIFKLCNVCVLYLLGYLPSNIAR